MPDEEAQSVRVIGVDCATDPTKVGVAIGIWQPGRLQVLKVEVCTRKRHAAIGVGESLETSRPALLAIDAPLGWPERLGTALAMHQAGAPIAVKPELLFRRATDRFVQCKVGKTPLDVGADRIARTAKAALDMLETLRVEVGIDIPLVWDKCEVFGGTSAIEVYPAATLVAHGLLSSQYKKPKQIAERRAIIAALHGLLTVDDDVLPLIQQSADALDAVVCLLAAKDFMDGAAMPPQDLALARREGWIWVVPPKDPAGPRSCPRRS